MEEKTQVKINLKTAILIGVIVIVLIVAIYVLVNKTLVGSEAVTLKSYGDKNYYVMEKEYDGEYDLQELSLSEYSDFELDVKKSFEVRDVVNYAAYDSYCKKWDIEKKYGDSSKNYILFSYAEYNTSILNAKLVDVEYKNNGVDIYIWDNSSGVTADVSAYVLVVPTEKNIQNVNIVPVYTQEEFENIQKYDTTYNPENMSLDKPIIYLYPEEEVNLSVKVGYPDKLTCSYPNYIDGWDVLAKPNGDLIDLDSNRNLYALYYESESMYNFDVEDEGFVVKGSDVDKFLEEKLAVLGLNEKEAEEFIVYWLPKLQKNKYNYIRFATIDEINDNMPLEFSKQPDTLIRILMTYKELDEEIDVKEQVLSTPKREGFVAVEWGGTEIK